MNAAMPWQQGLEQLCQQDILAGYALVTRDGLCETVQGLLRDQLDCTNPDGLLNTAQELSHTFDAAKQTTALTLMGHKVIVYKQTPCDMYAISRHKRFGVCFNNLPFGLLISVFEKPQLPQTVIPKLEAICSVLRA